MRTDPDELFEIGIVCQYPNVFEPRPGSDSRMPTYSIRLDVNEARMTEPQRSEISFRYSKYLPSISVTANRPPILTPTGPGAYDVFVNAMQIARERRLHLDAMIIGMKAEVQVCWFDAKHPTRGEIRALSFRGLKFDPYDLLVKATED